MNRANLALLFAVLFGVLLMGITPARPFAAEDEAAEYSMFFSPPERVDALFWAIVDCCPVRDLAEAKERFLAGNEGDSFSKRELVEMGLWPSEESLAALEADFGDMPEFWQALCYFDMLLSQTRQADIDLLERAYEVAPEDPVTMYFLADARCTLAESNLEDAEEPLEDQSGYRQAMRDAAELMVRAAECEPQNAFYYYEAALVMRKLEDYERATELLRLGNLAPANVCVHIYPLSYIVCNLGEIREQDDGSGKFRLLGTAVASLPVPTLAELQGMGEEYQGILAASGDTELLNTLHVFACRYGQQQYASLIQALIAARLIRMINESAVEIGAVSGDPDTLKSLASMNRVHGAGLGLVTGCFMWGKFLYDEGLLKETLYFYWPDEPTPEEAWAMHRTFWEHIILDFLYVVPSIAHELQKLEGYRYHEDGTITEEPATDSE